MNRQWNPPLPRPPRIAEWLVHLFVPANVAEAVTGDLQEKFSSLVSSGIPRARAWYRRQAAGTILRSGPNALRSVPLRMLTTLVGGLWLLGFTTSADWECSSGCICCAEHPQLR